MFINEQKPFVSDSEKISKAVFQIRAFMMFSQQLSSASGIKSEHFNLEIDCTPNNTNPTSMLFLSSHSDFMPFWQ